MPDARDTVAAVDAQALQDEALAAVAAAGTLAELDEARVRYLGRKSRAEARPARRARPGVRHGAQRGA